MSSLHLLEGHGQRGQLKVVFIETQYINTDAVSFKSVVQRLTGKDSSHQEAVQDMDSPPSSLAGSPISVSPNDFIWPSYTPDFFEGMCSAEAATFGAPMLDDKLSSFRDFERMISQLPPVEDMYHFWDNL